MVAKKLELSPDPIVVAHTVASSAASAIQIAAQMTAVRPMAAVAGGPKPEEMPAAETVVAEAVDYQQVGGAKLANWGLEVGVVRTELQNIFNRHRSTDIARRFSLLRLKYCIDIKSLQALSST